MAQALPQSTAAKNALVVLDTPHVKSVETCKLFNAGVTGNSKTSKSADPTCYNVSTVELIGLFDIVEMKMERTVALKKLGNLLGKKLGYRVAANAPTKEEREAAKIELAASLAERNKIKAERDARYEAILAADSEYQTLKIAYSVARDKAEKLLSLTRHYRITVGTSEGMFFLVKAEGDSWEEVIDKLTTKEKQVA